MRNYQTKSNQGALPDSISSTRFGAGEFNSVAVELEGAVTTSGQTLAPADGTGEVTDQLSMALAIYGAGGATYHVDTGAVNAYVLTPVSPKESPNVLFNGFSVVFEPGTVNTTVSTVNVGGLGVKSITLQNGTALSGGELSGTCCLKYNLSDDRFELIYSSDSFISTSNYYEIDASQADQGATSTNSETYTIYDVATLVGTSKFATIHLSHNPAAGNQTLYTFDTSLDLTTYPFLNFDIDNGAQFDRTTGDEVLTFHNPSCLDIGNRQQITSVDMIVFANVGEAYPYWWGALGDDSNDDGPAFNYALSSGAKYIRFFSGIHLLGETLELYDNSISLKGVSAFDSILEATHSSGAVIHVKGRSCTLKHIGIDASAARQAGGAGSNFGILLQPDDDGSDTTRYTLIEDFELNNQPNHGIITGGSVYETTIRRGRCNYCDGHGILFDNGTELGMTNLFQPGLATLETIGVGNCGGNPICLGGLTAQNDNRAVRITLINVECADGATDASVRLSNSAIHIYGTEITVIGGAVNASDYGIYAVGSNIYITNTRFLHQDVSAVKIASNAEYTTTGVRVKDFYVIADTALDPAVDIEDDLDNIEVSTFNLNDIDSVITQNHDDILISPCRIVQKGFSQTVNNSTSLVDDTALFIPMHDYELINFRVVLFYDGATAADFKLGFTVPASANISWGPANNIIIDPSASIVLQNSITSSGSTISIGAGGATVYRTITIVGQARTNGTSGNLQLQWAQNTANASDTRVLGWSHMQVW